LKGANLTIFVQRSDALSVESGKSSDPLGTPYKGNPEIGTS